jgi:hypothetical protein
MRQLSVRLAALTLCLAAACTKRPLEAGREAGSGGIDVMGTDAEIVDAGPDASAPRDALAPDLAEALACAANGDCVVTWFPQPVTSTDDCYCGFCAVLPLNKATDAAHAAQWEQYCRAWVATANCPILPCFAPPKVACVAGLCRTGSFGVPTSCPTDPTGGCGNAVACAGACCAPGEWCDDAIGCRCGYNLGCPVGQTCGRPYTHPDSPTQPCGDTCCFDCSP